jgi:hypothetical protein
MWGGMPAARAVRRYSGGVTFTQTVRAASRDRQAYLTCAR